MNIIFRFIKRINFLPIFDTSILPNRELISRICAIILFSVFLLLKIRKFSLFPGSFSVLKDFFNSVNNNYGYEIYQSYEILLIWIVKLATWLIEIFILGGYIYVYIRRKKAVGSAVGFMQTIFPFFVAVIPFLITLTPYNFAKNIPVETTNHLYFYTGIMLLIILGVMIKIIALITLQKAFSIMAEARLLIMTGIFKYIRHPLYTGGFIAFLGSLILRLHFYTVIMFLFFLIGKLIMAVIEEKKLIDFFPDYKQYKNNTGMFLPKIKSIIKRDWHNGG